MAHQTITKGNSAVVINIDSDGQFFANLYVNARDGIRNADITMLRWEGKTERGAINWANKQLAAA